MAKFNWHDYYHLARQIEKTPDDQLSEARARSIISRIYYSAYHIALETLMECEDYTPTTATGQEHAELIRYYEGLDPSIAQKLVLMKKYRRESDYDDSIETIHRKMTEAFSACEALHKKCLSMRSAAS